MLTSVTEKTLRYLAYASMGLWFTGIADARTWTSANGKQTFEGALEAYDPGTGMLSVDLDGKTGTFNQAILSPEDIAYLKQLGAFQAETPEPQPRQKAP